MSFIQRRGLLQELRTIRYRGESGPRRDLVPSCSSCRFREEEPIRTVLPDWTFTDWDQQPPACWVSFISQVETPDRHLDSAADSRADYICRAEESHHTTTFLHLPAEMRVSDAPKRGRLGGTHQDQWGGGAEVRSWKRCC